MQHDDLHNQAKMDVLQALRKVAMDLIQEHANGPSDGSDSPDDMQKVAVMAHDKQGLQEGLDKAKEVLHGMPKSEDGESDEDEESPEEEAAESPEEEHAEQASGSEDGSDEESQLMAKLEALRAKKKMK